MTEADHTPSMADERVAEKTGKTWEQWFRVLDEAGAADWDHKRIADHVAEQHGVSGWWAQSVTVEYERARGLRALGQRRSGEWEFSVQRTVATSPKKVEAEFRQARRRAAWLEDARLDAAIRAAKPTFRSSDTKMGRVLRWDLDDSDEGGRLEVTLAPRDDGRSVVTVTHSKLASSDVRDDLKARWTTALDALRDAHA